MRKFSGGEKFKVSHQDHNRWQEAGRWIGERGSGTGGIVEPFDEQTGVIIVKNNTALDLPRFSVLGLNGSVNDPLYDAQTLADFKNQIVLKGELPSSDTEGKFCILLTEANAGALAPAIVSGVTTCKVNVANDEHTHADITADEPGYLTSGDSGGAHILYKPPGTGQLWCVVRLSNRNGSEVNMVQVVHPGETTGEVVLANASGVHPGFIATANELTLERGDAVWILFTDGFDDNDGLVPVVNEDYYGPARRSGDYTVAGDSRPLYVLHRGDMLDIVQVYNTGETDYELVAPNADNVHPGKVKRIVDGVMTTPGDCWIAFVDDWDNNAGDVSAVNKEYYGPARLSGSYTSGGTELPLYVVRRGAEQLVHFELTDTLALSGDAPAILLSDNGADWADTATAIQVYDWFASEGMWAGISGYRGYALKREGTHASGRPKYDIVWMEQIAQTIQFTTTEYMGATTANRVAATVDWYDHQGKDPGSSVTLRDPQGQFPDVHSGAKGTAVYDYHNGYYRIVSCQRVALFAGALANGAFCATSTPSIDNFAVKPTGDYVGSPPTTPSTGANTCGHAGEDNDAVLLRRINNTMPNPTWEIVDVSLHSLNVITTVEISGGNLQYKTKTIYTERCSNTESSPTTIASTTTSCP